MGNKVGYLSYVGFAEESVFGTGVPPTGFIEYNSEGFKKDIAEKLVDAINGTQHYKKRVQMEVNQSGSISFPLVPGMALRLLKDGIGDAITTTSLAAGVFQYKFIAGINSLTSLSFECGRNTADTTSVMRYTGSVIDSIKFAANLGGFLQVDVSTKGRDEVLTNSITTASYRTLNPYTFVNGSIKVGDNSGVATSPSVDAWSLQVKNNVQEVRAIGSNLVQAFTPGMQDVTYDLTTTWQDNTLYNRFLNGTASYVYALFDNLQTIASTYTHQIKFESFKCYFNGTTPNVGGPSSILKASYPIRSIFNDGSSTTLLITVQTDVATLTTS